jgi:hypothetical protein
MKELPNLKSTTVLLGRWPAMKVKSSLESMKVDIFGKIQKRELEQRNKKL